ncbi:hypothetical protein A5739_11395 [Mycobacterium colombiense]|uniref:DUF732 domain-containing protein n=1 Tax=Mycobacterium colombiense TaxID=339268 RepID=UPI00096EAC78|nr:DUF732 domain-containing protein [Mycobacterium colombiense]OMC32111.1 hypothetical protein A5739_11395 [Mycobacterium colombiense]
MKRLVVLAALLIGAVAAAPIAHADADDEYLAELKSHHIEYSTSSAMVRLGRAVCVALADDQPVGAIMKTVHDSGGYSSWDSGIVVGASVGSYCPQYWPAVQQFANDNSS